jgi:pimeloyl-ACP methyl ester carboxylesterase
MTDVVRRTFGVGGAALSALCAGDGAVADGSGKDGEVVVLLHGIPTSAELFREVLPPLADAGFDVFAFDLPGYGHTLVPSRTDHSLAGAAELLATWMRTVLNRPVWLVGHDLGGAVAQILATRHPTLLSRLTLSNCPAEDAWPIPPITLLKRIAPLYPTFASVRPLAANAWSAGQVARVFHDPSALRDDDLHRIFWDRKMTDADGRRAFARHLKALDNRQTLDAAPSLARLPMPTQIVWGGSDPALPWDRNGRRLQELLADPDVTIVERAGHFVPLEQPQAFADALLDWTPASG